MRVVILLAVFLGAPAFAQTYKSDEHSFRVVQVVKGLEQPWSLAFLPDGRMLATEKAGRLRMIANGRLEPQPIAGLPRVTVHGQGGLHDVVLHPQFEQNRLVYLAYAARGEDGVGTELARGRLADGRLEEVQVLFRQSPKGRTGNHFGGRIVFDRAGYVYLTLGDRGEMPRAQKPDDHAGSTTAACPTPILSSANRAGSRRSSTSAIATSRARRCIRRPGCCGRTSTAPRAATK